MKMRFFIILILLAGFPRESPGGETSLRDGDLVFQASRSSQSAAIQEATRSPYSHMGIVFFRKGSPFVLEAGGTVGYTPLKEWVARGEEGRFVAKRLVDANARLTPGGLKRLRRVAASFVGRKYDTAFEWSDDRIYCSELAWKVYDRALGVQIGFLQKLSEFDLSGRSVQRKIKERFGDQAPWSEPVVSPAAMFNSSALVTVPAGP